CRRARADRARARVRARDRRREPEHARRPAQVRRRAPSRRHRRRRDPARPREVDVATAPRSPRVAQADPAAPAAGGTPRRALSVGARREAPRSACQQAAWFLLTDRPMSRIHLLLSLIAAGCVGSHGGDDNAPPFTNGVSMLSGAAEPGYVDGVRGVARFHNPVGVAFADGKVYVADFDNGKIRVVSDDGTTGTVVAQQGFARPFGMAFAGGTLSV